MVKGSGKVLIFFSFDTLGTKNYCLKPMDSPVDS